ncbi:unnamed protein product [Prorocentrum cordatum]|uniref:PS II complex 12 kDa extrinsic protein n=1 Tax=Prorocentrum cordatum TaxID=2364126 RepID=A0ABN9V2Q8_9DINO|nr:unnamed protein product [Polarella glacialis]
MSVAAWPSEGSLCPRACPLQVSPTGRLLSAHVRLHCSLASGRRGHQLRVGARAQCACFLLPSVARPPSVVGVLFVVMILLLISPVTGANLFQYGTKTDTYETIGDKVAAKAPEAKALTKALGYSASGESP